MVQRRRTRKQRHFLSLCSLQHKNEMHDYAIAPRPYPPSMGEKVLAEQLGQVAQNLLPPSHGLLCSAPLPRPPLSPPCPRSLAHSLPPLCPSRPSARRDRRPWSDGKAVESEGAARRRFACEYFILNLHRPLACGLFSSDTSPPIKALRETIMDYLRSKRLRGDTLPANILL